MKRPPPPRADVPRPGRADSFLLSILRREFGNGGATAVPRGAEPAWRRAAELGIAPLVFAILRGQGARAGGVLAREYARAWGSNERNTVRLAELLDRLGGAGVRVMLLKGAHLALFVYRDVGMRPMVDVDILVRPGDLPAAERVLAAEGYVTRPHVPGAYEFLGGGGPAPGPHSVAARYRELHHHLHPMGSASGLPLIDVHRAIASPSLPLSIDAEGMWERAERRSVKGREAWVLSPGDAILHLAVHAAGGNRLAVRGLVSLCDIAAVIARAGGALDWDRLRETASAWRAGRLAHLPLLLASRLLGAPVPEGVIEALEPAGFPAGLAEEAARRVLPHSNLRRLARLLPGPLVSRARPLLRALKASGGRRRGGGLDAWLGGKTGGTAGRTARRG